jgi:hypothetical protein
MSEASPLATLLQERRVKAAALEAATEEKRKKSDEVAAGVPSHWRRAENILGTAIDSANKDFAAAASPSRFQFEPLSQPGGNFALGLLRHSGNNGGDFFHHGDSDCFGWPRDCSSTGAPRIGAQNL